MAHFPSFFVCLPEGISWVGVVSPLFSLTTRSGFGHRRGLILKKDGMIMVRKIWHGSPIVLLTTILITMVINHHGNNVIVYGITIVIWQPYYDSITCGIINHYYLGQH